MAEKITEGRRMSRNIMSDKVAEDEEYDHFNKVGGRKSGEKPPMEIYRPRMGMQIRRTEDQSWRTSKSPSPGPNDTLNKNRQVNQSHGKPKSYNKKFESRNSNHDASNQTNQKPNKNLNDVTSEMKNLSISVNNEDVPVIDLTLSPSRTTDDKKKPRKPEQAIYVPKGVSQNDKDRQPPRKEKDPTPLPPQAPAQKHEEENWDENPKGVNNDNRYKRKMKGKGRGRDGRESVEKEFPQSYKDDNSRRHYDNNRPVQKQMSADNARYQRDQPKNDRRNYNQKKQHPDDRRRVENSKSATSNFRKSNDALDYDPTPQSPETFRNQDFNVKTDKRDFRQNSEPRMLPHGTNIRHNANNNNNRLRDTRSMENSGWSGDKIQSKPPPPPGRRGNSSIQISKPAAFDSLPPRLKKKYMEEKMAMSLPPNTYIGTSSEEQWDGGSLSFMNNSTPNYPVQQQYSMPPPNYYPQYPPPQQWSQTIPSPKGRGRGRLRPDEIQRELQLLEQNQMQSMDCVSPQDSRPITPLKNVSQSHENISHDRALMPPPNNFPSRSYSSHDQVGSYEEQYFEYDSHFRGGYKKEYDNRKSNYDGRNNSNWKDQRQSNRRNQFNKTGPPSVDKTQRSRKLSNTSSASTDLDIREHRKSPEPPIETTHTTSNAPAKTPSKILDWSEEVEESERQEREAMSRSSSLASLTNAHNSRDKRKPRRRGPRKERSLSRESGKGYRNNSQDRYRNQRRQSDENVYRPASRDRNKGHYGFHKNTSRESSRERESKSELLDWRRGGDYDKNDKDWRRDKERRDDKDERGNWREEKDDKGSWRDEKKKDVIPHHDLSIPPPNLQQPPSGYQQRGFIQLNQPPQAQQQSQPQPQRQLFDPSNPNKPIIVNSLNSRVSNNAPPSYPEQPPQPMGYHPVPQYQPYHAPHGDGNQLSYAKDSSPGRPPWYDYYNDSYRSNRNPGLLHDIEKADIEIQTIIQCSKGSGILQFWSRITNARVFLQQSLHTLLTTEIRFCIEQNVEQHMWKITYYNLIETLRKSMAEDVENKESYKSALLSIIDDGLKYFEKLIQVLEETYNFKVENYLSNGGCSKGPGNVGLALISTQKMMLFLGDLARYKEVANESNSYGKSKQWYSKAQQLNPKNGRPYYQLGILAFFYRRKLDAVYYYMRSLMASNPLQSAKESLVSLFDENRKKYELIEKRKREEKESKYKERVKEKEGSSLRREIWVHPNGKRRRVHRTTSTSTDSRRADSEDEELSGLSSVDVNKRFTISYLHVHGKLFTKVGMETFQDAGLQMLREFRALLQHTPLPLNCTRFLQLLALNMFAIENTQLKDTNLEPGYRSAVQENALIISLQMFNLILERCVALLREQLDNPSDLKNRLVGEDVQVLLPAVKVWCDWLLCHLSVWNPPPSCSEYRIGPPGDAWNRLAALVNLLEKLEHKKTKLVTAAEEGYELVRLPEDSILSGFTPLMLNEQDPIYTSVENDMGLAQCCLRIRKILFFGTVFLCGIDPPVLKLQKFDGFSEYISVVDSSGQSRSSPTEDQSDEDISFESFSEDESDEHINHVDENIKTEPTTISLDALEMATSAAETRRLLIRKEELEKRHKRQERQKKKLQAYLEQSGLSVEIEIRPKYLVPDTNCFIDYLSLLQKIASSSLPGMDPFYILTVPLIVVNELEGLARGGRDRDMSHMSLSEQAHAADVSECARTALAYLRSSSRPLPTIRCVTTNGKFLNSFTTFTVEEDFDRDIKNDDRVLATCLSLCRNSGKDPQKPGEPRHLTREVVLLTEDRNLRVKALARDVPVREVPDFVHWAELG